MDSVPSRILRDEHLLRNPQVLDVWFDIDGDYGEQKQQFQDRFHDSGKAFLIGVVYGLPLTLNPKELLCRTSMPLASSTTGA